MELPEVVLILTLVIFTICVTADCANDVTAGVYLRCPRGLQFRGQQLATVTGRSHVDCAARCSRTSGCMGVNVCLDEQSGHVTCSMMTTFNSGGCDGLTDAGSQSCFYVQSSAAGDGGTPEIVCENGGTASGGQCLCPPQYGGATCQRLVRDCAEIYENGYQDSSYDGIYDIQPVGKATAFKVPCIFDNAGITVVMQRKTSSTSLFNQNWATLKAGINLPPATMDDEFFIGLENLHQLLLQGEYQLVVYAEWSSGSGSRGSAYYDNLNIGTEDTKFELSYDSFRADVDKPIDNGFPTTSGPIKFYTNDMDFMCTMSSGGAGWFVSSCTSKGKIFTATMQWPVSGVTQQLDLVQLSLTRTLAIADP